MSGEPIAEGVVVIVGPDHRQELAMLARDCVGMLKAMCVEARIAESVAQTDLVLLLLSGSGQPPELPSLAERAGAAIGIGSDETRPALARTRKALRAAGATLGPHELVLPLAAFGYLGLESDGQRERLEVMLRVLANEAERLRLKREGWEEPEA